MIAVVAQTLDPLDILHEGREILERAPIVVQLLPRAVNGDGFSGQSVALWIHQGKAHVLFLFATLGCAQWRVIMRRRPAVAHFSLLVWIFGEPSVRPCRSTASGQNAGKRCVTNLCQSLAASVLWNSHEGVGQMPRGLKSILLTERRVPCYCDKGPVVRQPSSGRVHVRGFDERHVFRIDCGGMAAPTRCRATMCHRSCRNLTGSRRCPPLSSQRAR